MNTKKALPEIGVTEFKSAVETVGNIVHTKSDAMAEQMTRVTVKICQILGIDVNALQREKAYDLFDQYVYLSAYILAIYLKQKEEK